MWADPVVALALLGVWMTLAIIFNGEPEIDRAVSTAFFTFRDCPPDSSQIACGEFLAMSNAFLRGLRSFFHAAPVAVAAVVLVWMLREIAAGRRFDQPRTRVAATALATLALGPGLLVNYSLKDFWGRPRPFLTAEFGGPDPFVPAGQWSDACDTNCSFVSGEASAIFWLFCLIPLLPPGWRRSGTIVVAGVAAFTCLLRIAFGGHYLSDVVLGGLSTLIIFAALASAVEWTVAIRALRSSR
jgi:membrane-associated phospholipid phosphatase